MDLTAGGTFQTAWDQWIENTHKSWPLKTAAACVLTTRQCMFFASVDANYHIINADVGCQGHISDGEGFTHTTWCTKLEKNRLCIPVP